MFGGIVEVEATLAVGAGGESLQAHSARATATSTSRCFMQASASAKPYCGSRPRDSLQ